MIQIAKGTIKAVEFTFHVFFLFFCFFGFYRRTVALSRALRSSAKLKSRNFALQVTTEPEEKSVKKKKKKTTEEKIKEMEQTDDKKTNRMCRTERVVSVEEDF